MNASVLAMLLGLAAIVLGAGLLRSGLRDERATALSCWTLALLLTPVGWLVYRSHSGPDDAVIAIVGKVLIAVAFALQYSALIALGRPRQRWPQWVALVPLAVIALCIAHRLIWPERPLGSGLLSVIGSWMALLCAVAALRLDRGEESGRHGRMLALNFCLVAIALMLRAALLLLPEGVLLSSALTTTLSQDWLVVALVLAPVLGSFHLAQIGRERRPAPLPRGHIASS